jgi:hypothetical protein
MPWHCSRAALLATSRQTTPCLWGPCPALIDQPLAIALAGARARQANLLHCQTQWSDVYERRLAISPDVRCPPSGATPGSMASSLYPLTDLGQFGGRFAANDHPVACVHSGVG